MGRFIVFEGSEGCGKTTQIEMLSKVLQARGKNVTLTREPGGTPFAEDLRAAFKKVNEHKDNPTALCELFLVLSARAQHVEKIIKPFIENEDSNSYLLCDRFLDSTYVYQGILRGLPKQTIDAVAKYAVGNIHPNVTFVFTCSAEVSWSRIKIRSLASGSADRLDESNFSDFAKLASGFETCIKENWAYPTSIVPKRVQVNAEQSIQHCHDYICNQMKNNGEM